MSNKAKLVIYRIFSVVCIVLIALLLKDKFAAKRTAPEVVSSIGASGFNTTENSGQTQKTDGVPDGSLSGTFSDERKPDYTIIDTLIYDPVSLEYTWTSFENLYYATVCYSIDRRLYEYYKSLPRYYGDNEYIRYINDPINSEYINMIVENINEVGDQRGYTAGERVREAIQFVQSMAYVTDAENTSKLEWPKYPLEMLYDREGDCEDASLLLAGMLAKMGYGSCLIKFSDHMAVGIKGDGTLAGNYYTFEDNNYYYIESTNTGWDIGDMPEEYLGMPATVILIN